MTEPEGHEPTVVSSLSAEVLERLHTFPGDKEDMRVVQELNDQTPRGLAILGTAYLEWKLREAIKTQLPFESMKCLTNYSERPDRPVQWG